jgi:hypothetical protein
VADDDTDLANVSISVGMAGGIVYGIYRIADATSSPADMGHGELTTGEAEIIGSMVLVGLLLIAKMLRDRSKRRNWRR